MIIGRWAEGRAGGEPAQRTVGHLGTELPILSQ